MTDTPLPKEPKHVSCEVCRKQIPESAAMSHEAEDYVIHFCGIECYSHWRDDSPQEHAPAPPTGD